ncbi:MAG: hypothetical protein Q9166_001991 [cf. Caloplaca sp. 2 TL-2023]
MSSEEGDFPRQFDADDSQASTDESMGQSAQYPIDLDEDYLARNAIFDYAADTTMSHNPPAEHETINLDACDAYDTDVEELETAPPTFRHERQVRIKQEPSSNGDGMDGSSPRVKIEILDDDFNWTAMGSQTIDLTESDHEKGKARDQASAMPGSELPLVNVNIGRSLLRKQKPKPNSSPADIAKLIEAQRKLAERQLKRTIATGASSIFGGGGASSSQPFGAGPSGSRPSNDADTEATSRFEKIREEYSRKRALRINNFEDDVMWGKARAAERNRIKHIEEGVSLSRGIDISSDEAMESDGEGLFVPQGKTSNKRPHAEIIDDRDVDDEDEIQVAGNASEKDIFDTFGSEVEANTRIKKKAPSKRQAAKARARDTDDSRLAGVEEFLQNEKRKERKAGKPVKPRKKRQTKVSKDKSAKGKNGPQQRGRPRPGQPGYLLNSGSLMSSNIYEEANNNLNAAPAPDVRETRKDKALKAMLIDIPLEDLKQARGEKKNIEEATKVLGKHGRCYYAGNNKWGLKGMSTTLYHHQVQGAAWMKLRETGDVAPYGGLLADQMGLGKTLMILACMVSNRPEPIEERKATLIVCTVSIVHQWEEEINNHTEGGVFPVVLRHLARSRISGSVGAHLVLERANVIVTTYDEVRKSYPKFEPPKHIVLPEKKRAWWDENYEGMRGQLHQVHWYRVVLDEAQAIKNRDSQTSIACRGLMAKHRWAVSATPIQNHVGELYAFFKLLRVQHTGNYKSFRDNFCNPKDPKCGPRLHALLRQFMMRRTHADTVMGRPIVTLPRNSQETIEVELNPIERALYDTVQRRFAEAINQCGRDGTLEKSYRHVLHMLLRLRQMTGHPFMLQDIVENLFQVEDIERLTSMTISEDTAEDDPSRDMLAAMKYMIREKKNPSASADVISDAAPSEENVEDDFTSQAEISEPLVFNFRRFLRELVQGAKWTEMKARSLCHKCGDVPDVPHVTDCFHLYCLECLRALQQEAAVRGEESAPCCACATYFKEAKCCTGVAELEMETPISSQATGITSLTGSLAPRRNNEKETLRWLNYNGEVLPSTKTAAVLAQIEEWQRVEPEKKIIIFSQFHTLMTVLGKMFKQKEWNFVKYNGRMKAEEREKTLDTFAKESECKIMIASLKAGGVGLNLTMASKVICVDLWWNSSVEQQAFCRVFRIGQTSETFITRFVARNTVDDKLLQMQKHKAEAIGHAIDDEKMLQALSLRELMGLFGQVRVDEEDHPFILVDDEGEYDNENPPTII